MPSFAIIGGTLLNVGVYLTFKGRIFQAVRAYLVADLCWIAMAWERGDIRGIFFIAPGITFGLPAFRRMHRGDMEKSLNPEERSA